MGKPFKTLDEQCDILISRNLVIDDLDFAKRYLLHNNYYEVMNTCGKLFTNLNSDNFFSWNYF